MNCHDTTAPFTVSADHGASLPCANLPADSAFYGVLVHRLIALLQASFRQSLAQLPLPFASRYCTLRTGDHQQGTCTPLAHIHAGRTHCVERTRGLLLVGQFCALSKVYFNSTLCTLKPLAAHAHVSPKSLLSQLR